MDVPSRERFEALLESWEVFAMDVADPPINRADHALAYERCAADLRRLMSDPNWWPR